VPGGKYLATSNASALSIWDLSTARVVRTITDDITPQKNGFSTGFAFTRDGKRILSGDSMPGVGIHSASSRTSGRILLLWDFGSGKLLARSGDLGEEPVHLAISHNGRLAVCSTRRGDILIWEPGKKPLRRVLRGEEAPIAGSVAFTRDDKHLIVVRRDLIWHQIAVATGKVLRQDSLENCDWGNVAPGEGTVATFRKPNQLHLYDPGTGKKRRLPLKEKVNLLELSFSPDARTLLALDRAAEMVQFWDVAKGQLLRRLRLPGLSRTYDQAQLVLSQDGKTLASFEEYSVVRLWDAATGKPRHRFPGHVRAPGKLAFSADGKEIVSYADRGRGKLPHGEVYRWSTTTAELLARVVLEPPGSQPLLAPGGRHLAEWYSETFPRSIRLFDSRTGKYRFLKY
jgi:WD40 repeat protein